MPAGPRTYRLPRVPLEVFERLPTPANGLKNTLPHVGSPEPTQRAYVRARDRTSARSARGGGGGGASSGSWTSARHAPAAAAGRTETWADRDGTFVIIPRYRTATAMRAARRQAMLPHPTFDVDGDGVVSQNDFLLATRFDVNRDGVLQADETSELRKEMVTDLVKQYRELPHAESQETESMIRKFTVDLDKTVRRMSYAA